LSPRAHASERRGDSRRSFYLFQLQKTSSIAAVSSLSLSLVALVAKEAVCERFDFYLQRFVFQDFLFEFLQPRITENREGLVQMAPRRGRRKKGLMREDAARDAMRAYGFEEGVIKVCIKELLELYGGEWFLIEEFSYSVLLNKCLEKQAELDNNVAVEEEAMAEEHNVEMAQEEQDNNVAEEEEMAEELNEDMAHEEEEEEEEQEQHVEYGRDHVGSNSASLVGCGAEAGEASVIDYASPPVAFHSSDYAHHSVGGNKLMAINISQHMNYSY
ncbi:hypothetical protein IGI04_010660, partial [Brassica rapa subsp. trilocularis]